MRSDCYFFMLDILLHSHDQAIDRHYQSARSLANYFRESEIAFFRVSTATKVGKSHSAICSSLVRYCSLNSSTSLKSSIASLRDRPKQSSQMCFAEEPVPVCSQNRGKGGTSQGKSGTMRDQYGRPTAPHSTHVTVWSMMPGSDEMAFSDSCSAARKEVTLFC